MQPHHSDSFHSSLEHLCTLVLPRSSCHTPTIHVLSSQAVRMASHTALQAEFRGQSVRHRGLYAIWCHICWLQYPVVTNDFSFSRIHLLSHTSHARTCNTSLASVNQSPLRISPASITHNDAPSCHPAIQHAMNPRFTCRQSSQSRLASQCCQITTRIGASELIHTRQLSTQTADVKRLLSIRTSSGNGEMKTG